MAGRTSTPIWRDVRFWRIASQVIFLAALGALLWYFHRNMQQALTKANIGLGFGFLEQEAGFAIGESVIEYDPSMSYGRAFMVGLTNTLVVAVIGIALATPLGILVGIARLSDNWLIQKLSTVYVEIMRNTPLLVQLTFWYFAVFLALPQVKEQIVWPGPIYLNNRGVSLIWFERSPVFTVWALILLTAAVAGIVFTRWYTRRLLETGKHGYPGLIGTAFFLTAAVASWFLMPQAPATPDVPQVVGTNVDGGFQLSPEMAALVVSLVTYTSAFIGEIVRAGIQAVAKGQVEAARALGLKPFEVLRLVVFPQAMRIIIPPLTSQYLNLTKNSSLAIAVGYADLFNISTTIFNQTGRAVETFLLVMLVYLTFSLTTSVLMNLYNRSIRLVER